MTITAVTSYDLSLFLHIAAVVVGFGSTFALSIAFPVAISLDPRHLPYVHRLSLVLSLYFATPALVVVVATGFYQVSERDWELGDFWLSATMAIVVVLAGIIIGYLVPADRRLGQMVTREIEAAGPSGDFEPSAEYRRGAKTEGVVGALTSALLVIAVYLMTVKPGL